MSAHGYQPSGAGPRPPIPTTGSGVRSIRPGLEEIYPAGAHPVGVICDERARAAHERAGFFRAESAYNEQDGLPAFPVTRTEFEALVRRVAELERRLLPDGRD